MNSAKFASFLYQLIKKDTLQETAIHLVNVLAAQLQASRVSVGLYNGKHVQLFAISASASFDVRTEAMQLLAHAMLETCDQASDIYASHQNETTLKPLHYHQQLLNNKQDAVHSFLLRKNKQILGVILIERPITPALTAAEESILKSIQSSAAELFDLKQRAEVRILQNIKHRFFYLLQQWFGDKERGLKILGSIVIGLAIILCLPLQYHVTSDSTLQSTYKYLVVAPQDAYLKKIQARPGDIVKKGDVLAQLNDDELRLEERKVQSQRQGFQQEYDNALANGNRVDAAIANAKIEQASIQLELLEQQTQRAQLFAPVDGMVVSDDISQTLGAPLKQGDVLFEIAATSGYIVQLFVDEREIALINKGLQGYLKLTSLPGEEFEFSVGKITPISEIRNGVNVFRVEANLARETEQLRSGMTGSGKIAVGRRALGWIWFHDIWNWLRLGFW